MGHPEGYAAIEIAGEVKTVEAFRQLVEAMVNDSPDCDHLGHALRTAGRAEESILDVAECGLRLTMSDHAARYGEFGEIEIVCKAFGLWFTRSTEANHGIDAEDVTYNPVSDKAHAEFVARGGSYIIIGDALKLLEEGGPAGLAEHVRKRAAESRLALGKGMPDKLVVADEVLRALQAEKEVQHG